MAYWEEFDLLSSEEVFDVTASDVTRLAVKEAVGGKNVCVVVADSCTSSQMFECLTTAPEVLFNTQLGRFETVTDGTGFIEIAVSRDRNTPNGSFGVAYVIDKKRHDQEDLAITLLPLAGNIGFFTYWVWSV